MKALLSSSIVYSSRVRSHWRGLSTLCSWRVLVYYEKTKCSVFIVVFVIWTTVIFACTCVYLNSESVIKFNNNNNSNFSAATCRDAAFHTILMPCYSIYVPSIVEVANRSICLRQRGTTIYSELICIIRKIYRSCKHALHDPWIPA